MTGPIGLLPYGISDASIIFRRNLLAVPTASGSVAGDIGTCTVANEGSGASYDPVAGLYNIGTNDILISAINGSSSAMAALAAGGQIYFEVPTSWIACTNAISEFSTGVLTHIAEYALTFLANPFLGGFHDSSTSSSANNQIVQAAGFGTNIVTSINYFSNAIGQGEYTPIIVTINGNTMITYANGVRLGVLTKQNTILLPFDQMLLGRYSGTTGNLNVGRIRNLQISNKTATFSTPRTLSRLSVFGDSYANATNIYQAGSYNLDKPMTVRKVLNARGWDWGEYSNSAFGGRRVIGSNGTWNISDSGATYLAPNCASMLANHPSTVIFQAGANDLTETDTLSQANFTTSLRGFVEQCLGLNGNANADVEKIILCTTPWPPTFPTAAQANLRKPDIIKIFNAIMSIPAWLNSTYPARAGDVSVCDVFTAYDGFNSNVNRFGSADLLHPGPIGSYVMGDAWGKSLLNFLNT